MKKNLLSFLILLSFHLTTFAQSELTISPPYKVIDARLKTYFYNNNEILTLKIDGRRIYIQKLNASNLKFIKEEEYEDMPDNYVLEDIREFNKRYYLFYSLWDKPNETEQLFVREIDFANGTFKGLGKNLVKVKGRVTGTMTASGFYNFGIADKFSFNVSNDRSKLLIKYRLKPETRNDEKSFDVIGFCVFDKDLRSDWSREVKMPYTESNMNNIDYSIDSKGNAYILAMVFTNKTTDPKKGPAVKEPSYHMELLRIKANSNSAVITPISVSNKFINKIWLYEGPGDYMICAGYYNNGTDVYSADGVIMFKVDADGKLFDMKSYEIPVEVLNQYVSIRTQKKNEKNDDKDRAQFAELELRELLIDQDGSIVLIGEQYFVTSTTTYSSSGGSRTTYHYHYNDLLVTKIDAAGKLAWMKKIPKRQLGHAGQGGMGYKHMRDGENHYFLFLDNEKNLTLTPDKEPAMHSDGAGGFLTAYKVTDSKGEVSKFSVFNTRNVNGIEIFQFHTSRILQLSSNQFAVEAYKKKKEDVMIKVTFK